MTREQFGRALETLHWGPQAVAYNLHCDEKLVRKWRLGSAKIPPAVAAWLTELAAAHRALPPPKEWRAVTTYPSAA